MINYAYMMGVGSGGGLGVALAWVAYGLLVVLTVSAIVALWKYIGKK